MKKILSIALAIVLSLSLSACSSYSPTDITNTFLQAVKDLDEKVQLETYDGLEVDLKNILKDIETGNPFIDEVYETLAEQLTDKLSQFGYEVTNEKVDGDNATVNAIFKTYDIKEAIVNATDDFFKELMELAATATSAEDLSSEKFIDVIVKSIMDELNTMTLDNIKTVILPLVKADCDWKVAALNDSSDFLNAISGGLFDGLSYMKNALTTLSGLVKE